MEFINFRCSQTCYWFQDIFTVGILHLEFRVDVVLDASESQIAPMNASLTCTQTFKNLNADWLIRKSPDGNLEIKVNQREVSNQNKGPDFNEIVDLICLILPRLDYSSCYVNPQH